MLIKAIECATSTLPYQYAVTTRTALWGQWGIDANDRFSEYKRKIQSGKVNFKSLDLKLSLTLTLFFCNNAAEALKAMYVFGHPRILIPAEYRDDLYIENPKYHDDACYRVIFYVYVKYTVASLDDIFTIEKMRVERLKYALDYICENEPHLCDFFFEKKSKN